MLKTMICADKLDRYYADTHAVQNLSFKLKQGDVLGFLGPNGAGKSTTMQMLSGVLAPSAGRILINGIDLLEQPIQARAQLGYLPEKPPLYPELKVNEYLIFCAQLRRIKKADLRQALDLVLQRCDLTDVRHRIIGNLSKGYQQRVGIAQAIIHQPAVVILDEPSVGLDPIQVRKIRELIKQLSQQHSVILSTHILPEVQAVCNRVQIIQQGKLVFSDTMENINSSAQDNQLLVAFERPPAAHQLQAIDGISAVSALGAGRFRLQIENSQPLGERISQVALTQHWGLQELYREKQTLEQIFIELTSGEEQVR
jgi:ABC-2 type transport system ATP-binding protein